jgi:hypothetical protein
MNFVKFVKLLEHNRWHFTQSYGDNDNFFSFEENQIEKKQIDNSLL